MASFLLTAAGLVLAMAALGLVRIFYGPRDADRMIAVQLIGTCGVAILLLLAAASQATPITDVALILALLAAFLSVAFVRSAAGASAPGQVDDH
ncbi:MAG TPA: monovalent cation/H+ antiporter complex subunit F [Hyphomicrobiaceae bacterium]|nr:monovalent cation/H+ antiporter complex subunit F [Hyphomicrobiaceae bacterium]